MLQSLFAIGLLIAPLGWEDHKEPVMNEKLQGYIDQRRSEFDQIPSERKQQLRQLADYISARASAKKPIKLNFICTHNSRRSHMGQIWGAVAAFAYNIDDVHTYSGGTEATAFNPRAVAALSRAGLKILRTTQDDNPVYHVTYSTSSMPITSFSKVFNQSPNPKKDFAAIMTCSSADRACPIVEGTDRRFAITYEDPKAFDGTKKESAAYDERCAQIARELLFVFSTVKK